jgi:hypothetical protein
MERSEAQAVMNDIARRFAAARAHEDVLRRNALADYLWMGCRRQTPLERRVAKIKAFFDRFALAWRVLRGEEIDQ